jgi:hypothetical protein
MKSSVHLKHLSYDMNINEDFFKMHLKMRSPVGSSMILKKIDNTKQSLTVIGKNNSSVNICKSDTKQLRNKKLIIDKQLKLPKLGYLVTNFRAPIISSIETNIKSKIKKIRRDSGIDEEAVEKAIQMDKEERRRKSLIAYESDLEDDEKLEEILKLEPSNIMANRKGLTIHQIVKRLANTEKGIQVEENYEDENERKQIEIQNVKTQLKEIKKAQIERRCSVIENIQSKVRQEKMKGSKVYRTIKDAKQQLIQKKILNNKDFSIFSKLYLLNNNPLFTINNKISYQYTLNDSGLLANIYNVNLYKLRNMTEKYLNEHVL